MWGVVAGSVGFMAHDRPDHSPLLLDKRWAADVPLSRATKNRPAVHQLLQILQQVANALQHTRRVVTGLN